MKYTSLIRLISDKNVSDEMKEALLDVEIAKAEYRGMKEMAETLTASSRQEVGGASTTPPTFPIWEKEGSGL